MLRVLATFGVIFLHVSGTGIHLPVGEYNWYVAVVGDSLVRWSVPVFFMISGALFLKPEKEITVRAILTKYVKRLLTAYLFWYFAYMLFIIAVLSFSAHSLVIDRTCLTPHFHLWFLPMLMGVYLLIPILRRVIADRSLLRYSLILWLIYITISFALIQDVPQISHLFTMNRVVGYAGYFMMGYYISVSQFSRSQKRLVYVLGVVGVLATILGTVLQSYNSGVVEQKFLFYISPNVVMMSAALFLSIKELSTNLQFRNHKIIEYVRKDLFGIYLVHGFWLWAINRVFFRDQTNHIITLPLITILIFILSLYTTKLIRVIPKLNKVVE